MSKCQLFCLEILVSGEVPLSYISRYSSCDMPQASWLPLWHLLKRHIRQTDFPELDWVKGLKMTDLSFIFETSFLHFRTNMLRGQLLFSLQIICPFSCCSELRALQSVSLLRPAVTVVARGELDLGHVQEQRVCQRAREWSSSGQHRLALTHWCQQCRVGSWIPSRAVPTTHFGGGQHVEEEEKEKEEK